MNLSESMKIENIFRMDREEGGGMASSLFE